MYRKIEGYGSKKTRRIQGFTRFARGFCRSVLHYSAGQRLKSTAERHTAAPDVR